MNVLDLKNKKVAILGLGANNKQMALYLKSKGVAFEVLDNWKTASELTKKVLGFDILFRTPGLPFLSEPILKAGNKGIEVSSQTKLFFDLCPAKIIGVTGTKGKGTTSSLIAKIIEAANKKVWLAGNIGKDPFAFIDEIKPDDLVVLELSSFQLQDLHKSPFLAVVLGVSVDHLNHHKNFQEYIEAKSSILKYQTRNDFAVLSKQLPDWFVKLGFGKKFFFDPSEVSDFKRKLLGQHNLENISAAFATSRVLEISEDIVRKVVGEFEPLDHRLKIIKEIAGVTIVDDAFSTNIGPTMAAIDAFEIPIILIVGGFNKGLDFGLLGQKIKSAPNLKAVVLIGQVADKILKASLGFKGQVIKGGKNLKEILKQALSVSNPGDVVVFSPGTSSFDMFKNEMDRGEQFKNAVKGLE